MTFLTPPIHPSEMSRWSTLTALAGEKASEAPPEESREEKKEEEEVEAHSLEEVRPRPLEVGYEQLTMDMRGVCCGSSRLPQLRSPSSLWPEDRRTHGLCPASPMALPCAAPLKDAKGFRALSALAFRELLQFQDKPLGHQVMWNGMKGPLTWPLTCMEGGLNMA